MEGNAPPPLWVYLCNCDRRAQQQDQQQQQQQELRSSSGAGLSDVDRHRGGLHWWRKPATARSAGLVPAERRKTVRKLRAFWGGEMAPLWFSSCVCVSLSVGHTRCQTPPFFFSLRPSAAGRKNNRASLRMRPFVESGERADVSCRRTRCA